MIHENDLKLREAQSEDCKLLWEWTNDIDVRRFSFNSKAIGWDDHCKWFQNKQNKPECIQYVGLNQDVTIGQIRFDILGSIAEIDYSIDPMFRGKGFGKLLLIKGIELFSSNIEKMVVLQGQVNEDNKASIRVFQKSGFRKIGQKTISHNKEVKAIYHTYQLKIAPITRNILCIDGKDYQKKAK